jgi:hypothetical protein
MDCHLNPAEIAKRFGISIKALRLIFADSTIATRGYSFRNGQGFMIY